MCTGRGTQVWTYAALRSRHGRRGIERRVRGGTLLRVRRGVYATDRACVEVVTAAAHGGVLGCESAARHLGLWVLDEPALHVWMHHDRHQYPHEDCRCVTHWDAATSSSAFEQPGVPLVLRQIYGCRGPEAFFVAVESARRLGLIDEAGLRRLGDRLGAEGRDLIAFSRADADSGLESLVRLRIRRYGWRVRTQVGVVGTGRVDLLIDGWLIIETDGRANHEESSLRHRDLVRDATAAGWGHPTLRFDYAMVLHDWPLVERAILETMRRRP
ncbi:hypothetical protein [Microbacterium sp. NPDC077057]|uniref:hypothetical protein n=1 Tax=unclassified Microbacterium TaxID=2609290 RepID=UPI0034231C2D